MAGRSKPGTERRTIRTEVLRRAAENEPVDVIARALGIPEKKVCNIVRHDAIQRDTLADRERARAFLYRETVAMLETFADRGEEGDAEAARVALAIIDRLAKLTGADAPAEAKISGSVAIERIERVIVDGRAANSDAPRLPAPPAGGSV